MSSYSSQPQTHVVQTVSISYTQLKDKGADLSAKIEEGFGPNGLGILSIADVPGYSSLRQSLLHLSPRLAGLSDDQKRELEDPDSRYNFGWSHGKEKLESGKPDTLKGSFYANPVLDKPTSDPALIQRYPSYCGANIWPRSALPDLEPAFKALGKLILEVGMLLAYHCDLYVNSIWISAAFQGMKMLEDEGLEQILRRSRCHKGRLLYYFPAKHSSCSQDGELMSSWCGWHTDHGSLTGLARAMFKKDAVEISCPDNAAGLYVKSRGGQLVKVVYGEDEIAYQIGETTEILSRGRLCATPHCVRAPLGEAAFGVDRSTFALFMQPDWTAFCGNSRQLRINGQLRPCTCIAIPFVGGIWDEKLKFPEVVHIHQELIPSRGSLTFGEYTEKLLDKYYHLKM
ncbi:uncharacterized protein [Coffea arabica]|uniref:Uncharacterized protein isoform X3 n=1 Tax=Coffea arabica TaxID=13443 RepID=A0ABM4UN91_COFAR